MAIKRSNLTRHAVSPGKIVVVRTCRRAHAMRLANPDAPTRVRAAITRMLAPPARPRREFRTIIIASTRTGASRAAQPANRGAGFQAL